MTKPNISRAAAILGRQGGLRGGPAKSEAKTAASRANGARGGRPRSPGYVVFRDPDGGAQSYIGRAATLAAARKLARRHERGEISAVVNECDYTSWLASGHDIPEVDGAANGPLEWAGKDGYYGIWRPKEDSGR